VSSSNFIFRLNDTGSLWGLNDSLRILINAKRRGPSLGCEGGKERGEMWDDVILKRDLLIVS